ncbi:MAG: AraC family transcriptional regulator [Pseudomonadota bacterium]
MELDWRSTVLLVTGVPSVIAAVMAWHCSRERLASVLFIGLQTAWFLLTMPYIIGFSGAYDAYPELTFFPFNTELWLGPLWLLYIRALTARVLPERWWMWLLPGTIQTAYYTICFLFLGDAAAKFAFNDNVHEPYIVPFETALGLALIGFAALDSRTRIAQHRRWIESEHSNRERVDLAWLARSGFAIIMLALIWISADAIQAVTERFSYSFTFYIYALVGTVLLVLALEALSKVEVAVPKRAASIDGHPDVPEPPVSAKIDLDAVERELRHHGWHLDPDLTLSQLARKVGTNKTALSAAINHCTGDNFTSFINRLRVAEVCERLREDKGSQNLLQIAFEAGFGSKATFNRAFKKHTGMAPSAWIRAELT